jgi:hypothetical protein
LKVCTTPPRTRLLARVSKRRTLIEIGLDDQDFPFVGTGQMPSKIHTKASNSVYGVILRNRYILRDALLLPLQSRSHVEQMSAGSGLTAFSANILVIDCAGFPPFLMGG